MNTCDVALKEWAVVVEALRRGDQLLVLRKGGIADVGGEFHLEAERFLLWPTWLHQDGDWLAADQQHRLDVVTKVLRAGDEYPLSAVADVAHIVPVPSREALDGLAGEHIWSPEYLDMRWRYRPELPLYLLLLRVWNLPRTTVVRETAEQQGCRSWVTLAEPVRLDGLAAAVDQDTFAARAERVLATIGAGQAALSSLP